MPAAVYDMDLTITAAPTYTRWLVFWARRHAPWRLALLPAAAVVAIGYRAGAGFPREVKEIAQRMLMGSGAPRVTVEATAAAFAAQVRLRPGALAQLAADRAAGLDLVLATASFTFYVAAVAERLGIRTVVATASVWDGETLRPRLANDNCYGAAKATMVAARLGATPVAVAYSDHVSDVPLFTLAAVPVAVNPSAALWRLAQRRGWRIVDWR